MVVRNRQRLGAIAKALSLVAILAWAGALLLFGLHSTGSPMILALAVAMVTSVFAILFRPIQGLVLLPFPALMGPIYPVNVSGIGMITAADLYLLSLATVFILIDRRLFAPVLLGRCRHLLYAFSILLLFSWAFSDDIASSNHALANFIQLAAVYLLTLNLVRSADDVRRILTGWLVAVTLCSLLTILKYYQLEPLLIANEVPRGVEDIGALLLSSEYFFRATFFYAGFFFALAVTLIVILSRIAGAETLSFPMQLLLLLSGLVNASALLVMNTKSAIYSIALIGCFIVLGSIVRVKRDAVSTLRTGRLISGLAIITVGLMALIPVFLVSQQITTMFERFSSTESLVQRLIVYKNALQELISDEKIFIFGVGPDTIVRSPQLQRVTNILTDPLTGLQEGTIDSTFLMVLLELGVISFLILGALMVFTMWSLFKRRRDVPGDVYGAIAGGIAVWLLTASTQYMGWAKISWLFAVLMAMAHFLAACRPSSKLINVEIERNRP